VKRRRLALDAALVLGLIVLHEGMKRALSDGALVAALLSGGGAHSLLTMCAGVLMLTVRVTLFVVVPGSIGARVAAAALSAATRLP
jgi:hypothetical protein